MVFVQIQCQTEYAHFAHQKHKQRMSLHKHTIRGVLRTYPVRSHPCLLGAKSSVSGPTL